jgi:chromosomal replication initiator protein
VLFRSGLHGGRIDVEMVQSFLAQRNGSRQPPLKEIAAATAKYFSVRLSDLRSPSRRRLVVTARDVAIYLARRLTGESLKQIGHFFGGRDHSTVMHGCRKTESLLKTDPGVRQAVLCLQQKWKSC